jgi:TolB protein
MNAEPGATAREIHYEETSWKARPDFSADRSRMVYSSYLGGQWHNLSVRAWSEKVEYPVLDNYACATTSPIYINVAGAKPRSPQDAKYFAAWIVRTIEITAAYPDWNSAQEKQLVLRRLNEAKQI